MKYLLDSNVCIHCMRAKGSIEVKQQFAAHSISEMLLCSVVEGELLFGAETSLNPVATHAAVVAFTGFLAILDYDSGSAAEYAKIRGHLKRVGLPIGSNDMMIAAIALQHDLTLVTHNTAEFSRVPGLKLVDWEIP